MKKKNLLFLVFITIFTFIGMVNVNAFENSYSGLASETREGVPYYLSYGGVPTGDDANKVYKVSEWETIINDANIYGHKPNGDLATGGCCIINIVKSNEKTNYPNTAQQKRSEQFGKHRS